MKFISAFLLLLASFCLASPCGFAHSDRDHAQAGRPKQEIFDELIGYYQAILVTQKKILNSEALPGADKQIELTAGDKAGKPFKNQDMMSLLFAQVSRAYRLGIELDCGHECQTEKSQRELDQLEKSTFQRFQETFAKHAKKIGTKTKRFFVEFFPEMYQYTIHHGWSFGLWLLITEPLEHLVFSPFLGGLPICKFLYGVYFAIANPIRNFFGIALNRFDGRFDVIQRLKGAMTSWIYERRFKKRMDAVLVHQNDSLTLMTQKQYKKTLESDAKYVEHELAETPFWAEAYAFFSINTDEANTRSMAHPKHALYKDLNVVYGVHPKEVRFDRARRLIEGLRQTSKVMAEVLDSTYYENKNLLHPVSWFEFFGFKGLVGQVDRLIDYFSFNLQTVALSGPSTETATALPEQLRLSTLPMMEDAVREIAFVFEDALRIATIDDKEQRKAEVRGLLTRVKLLSMNQQRIASGTACKQALLPVELR